MDATRPENLELLTDIVFHEPLWDGHESHEGGVRFGGAGAYGFAGKPSVVRFAGTPMADWVDAVAGIIAREHPHAEDFRVEIDGVTWRCCRDRSGLSSEVTMRQIESVVPLLRDLNTASPAVISLLHHPFLNGGGLVVISGLNGSGKTTLCGAILRSRLDAYSGRCVSVEDPVELMMEGFIGDGVVRQMEVRYDDGIPSHQRGFAGALRRAYRKFPATRPIILYVGEVRDEETAVEILKAGSNGMLVLTTVHAENSVAAVERLLGLAAIKLGPGVSAMLASALRLSIHSTLEWINQPAAQVARMKRARTRLECLFSAGPSHATASLIRQGQFHQLNQVLEKQSSVLSRAGVSGMTMSDIYNELGGRL